ncbi:MAG TPA: hypothetical protein VHP33_13175 [Polyangiaceae bacterium]|nr:hypothetical protein [Polyangiaceae bacterium]
MTLSDLLVLYGAAGVASSAIVYKKTPERGRSALMSALLALPLWPLWLPVVLTAHGRPPAARPAPSDATRAAIWEAHEAVVGSPLEPLLPREAALRMLQEVERASERHRELVQLLGQRSFSSQAAEQRIEQLTRDGSSARSLAPARLHLENVRRLENLRSRDEQTLSELGELATTLRTQLVLARYAGSTPHDAGDIVSEVWARVEVLGSTLAPLPQISTGHASDQAHSASG